MCRNITILRGLDPPFTDEEVEAAALQYVRKVAGISSLSSRTAPAVDAAVEVIAEATRALLEALPAIVGTEVVAAAQTSRLKPLNDATRVVADQDDVRQIALGLPGVSESPGEFRFTVQAANHKERMVVWAWRERIHPKKPRVLNPTVIGIATADLEEKEALLAAKPGICFTEPHYDGYPAVLVRLDCVGLDELAELITDSWRVHAPVGRETSRDD